MSYKKLLDQAEKALREQRYHDALQLCDKAAQKGEEARYFAALLRGDALLELGDPAGALSSYESVADVEEPDPEVDLARGVALFEMCRFAEAENALRSALRLEPSLAEAHHTLGLIAELHGNGAEVEYFRAARKLDPGIYQPTPQMSREDFEGIVEEALTDLPDVVAQAIVDVPVLVAELPHPEDLTMADPPLSPRSLGLFVGPPPGSRSVLDGQTEDQPTILLFKRNLERACADRDQLIEEIRLTVIHEIGHALGLSEEDLEQRGLQ